MSNQESNRIRSGSNLRCPTCSNEFNVKIEEEQHANNQISHNVIIAAPLVTTSGAKTAACATVPAKMQTSTGQTNVANNSTAVKSVVPVCTQKTTKTITTASTGRHTLTTANTNATTNANQSLQTYPIPVIQTLPNSSLPAASGPVSGVSSASKQCPLHQVPLDSELHVKRKSRIGRQVQRMRSKSKKRIQNQYFNCKSGPEVTASTSWHHHHHALNQDAFDPHVCGERTPPNTNVTPPVSDNVLRSRTTTTIVSDDQPSTERLHPNKCGTKANVASTRNVFNVPAQSPDAVAMVSAEDNEPTHDLLTTCVLWLHLLCLLLSLADTCAFLRRRSDLAWQSLDLSLHDWLHACAQRDLQMFVLQLGTFALRMFQASAAVAACLTGNRFFLAVSVLVAPLQMIIALASSLLDVLERFWLNQESANSSATSASGVFSDSFVHSLLVSIVLHALQWYAFGTLVMLFWRRNDASTNPLKPINQWNLSSGICRHRQPMVASPLSSSSTSPSSASAFNVSTSHNKHLFPLASTSTAACKGIWYNRVNDQQQQYQVNRDKFKSDYLDTFDTMAFDD